jgi:hypothetical protein
MATGALKHTHQYFRRGDKKWACVRDGCTHFLPSNMAPAPAGRKSVCWSCEKEFTLYPVNMERDRPECDDCLEQTIGIEQYLEEMEMKGKEDSDAVFRRYGLKKTKPTEPAKSMEPDEPTSE